MIFTSLLLSHYWRSHGGKRDRTGFPGNHVIRFIYVQPDYRPPSAIWQFLILYCTADLNYIDMPGVKTKPLFYKRCTCWSIVYTNDHVYKIGCKVMKFEAFIWTETSKVASRRRSEDGVMWCKNGKEEFFCTYFYRAD